MNRKLHDVEDGAVGHSHDSVFCSLDDFLLSGRGQRNKVLAEVIHANPQALVLVWMQVGTGCLSLSVDTDTRTDRHGQKSPSPVLVRVRPCTAIYVRVPGLW